MGRKKPRRTSKKQHEHCRLNLQICTCRELLNCYGAKLSAKNIWNLVGYKKTGKTAKVKRADRMRDA